MSERKCAGSPTFNLAISDNAYSEWPQYIGGYICKTPPMGSYNAPRFSKCCSGKVYNITEPTAPDDPAYPMSCALFCQVDPAFDQSNDKYPYGFSDYYMCLNEGLEDGAGGSVVCATNTVDGQVDMPSFTTTPTGSWQTASYSLRDWDPFGDMTSSESPITTQSGSSTSAADISSAETTTTQSDASATGATTTTTTASGSPAPDATTEAAATTTAPNGAVKNSGLGAKAYVLGAMLVLSVLAV